MAHLDRESAIERLLIAVFILWIFGTLPFAFYVSEKTRAILFLIFALSFAVTALVFANPLRLRARIVALAVAYVGLILVFASLHFLLFLKHPDAYAFAQSVSAAQARSTVETAAEHARVTTKQLAMLQELNGMGESAFRRLKKPDYVVLKDGSSVYLQDTFIPDVGTLSTLKFQIGAQTYRISDVVDGDPRGQAVSEMVFATTPEEFKAALETLEGVLAEDQRIALDRVAHNSPVWGYEEFLYLSAVTMTTLGIGDIVPTSRTSRMLMSLESMSGVLVVAFALAFMWPQTAENPKD